MTRFPVVGIMRFAADFAQVDNTSGIHGKELDGVSFSTDSKTLTITLSSAEDETVADPVLRITLSDGSEDTFSLKHYV